MGVHKIELFYVTILQHPFLTVYELRCRNVILLNANLPHTANTEEKAEVVYAVRVSFTSVHEWLIFLFAHSIIYGLKERFCD